MEKTYHLSSIIPLMSKITLVNYSVIYVLCQVLLHSRQDEVCVCKREAPSHHLRSVFPSLVTELVLN